MKFADLVEQIKTESRVKGDDGFVPTIIGLMNELFKEAVESQNPFELRQEAVLPLTTGMPQVALPADFFIHKQVQFQDADTSRHYVLTDQDRAIPPAPRGLFGHPKSFEIAGQMILLKPAEAIVTGDSLHLVYYKFPPIVTQATLIDDNPIPRLEPFIVRGVIRRIRMVHADDLQVAQMLGGDTTSAAKAYTNDEPRRTS
jgi:hypothetical protein